MNLAYKKILGKFTKVLGFGKTPLPHVGKNSQIISFFFESVPKAISRLGWVVPLFGGTVAQIHYWVAVDISSIRWHTGVLGGRGGGQTNVTRVGGDYDGLAAKEGGGFEIDRLPKLPSHSLIAPSLVFFLFFFPLHDLLKHV